MARGGKSGSSIRAAETAAVASEAPFILQQRRALLMAMITTLKEKPLRIARPEQLHASTQYSPPSPCQTEVGAEPPPASTRNTIRRIAASSHRLRRGLLFVSAPRCRPSAHSTIGYPASHRHPQLDSEARAGHAALIPITVGHPSRLVARWTSRVSGYRNRRRLPVAVLAEEIITPWRRQSLHYHHRRQPGAPTPAAAGSTKPWRRWTS